MGRRVRRCESLWGFDAEVAKSAKKSKMVWSCPISSAFANSGSKLKILGPQQFGLVPPTHTTPAAAAG
jgi:hypothetical protein